MAVEYREPLYEIGDEWHRAALQRQYDRKISKQHELWGEEAFVIGKMEAPMTCWFSCLMVALRS